MKLEERVLELESKIASALKKSSRLDNSVTLVAVSKRQPPSLVREYCDFQISRGNPVTLGENYVQEFREKRDFLPRSCNVHLIGPLQRNKVRTAVELFDCIESVDSERLLAEINKEASRINKLQSVFLQINVSKDLAKTGFMAEELTEGFLESISKYTSIRLDGLMTITKLYPQPEMARRDFSILRELAFSVKSYLSLSKCCLSMGMSDDFEVAIEEGATHVRIGTALFGARVI